MPEETSSSSSNPCLVGGAQALYSSSRILKQLSDTEDFADIDKLVKETAGVMKQDTAFGSVKEMEGQIAEAIARTQLYGGDPNVYLTILRSADLNSPEVVEVFSDLMLRQQVTMHGMNAVKNKMKSLSKQISDGVDTGMKEIDIEDLELQLTRTNAQFRNYMAYNSTLGTGASRLLSQRRSSNIMKAFDSLTTNLNDKYKSALDGEAFLQENKITSKFRTKLQDNLNKLDDDINANPDSVTIEELQTRIADDEQLINTQSKEIDELKQKLDARKEELKDSKVKPTDDPASNSLNRQIKEGQEEIADIKELKDLRAELERLRKKGGDTTGTTKQIKEATERQKTKSQSKIKASEIQTKKQYDQFVNQSLGSKKARTFAKRLYFAAQDGQEDAVLHMASKMAEKSGFTKALDASLQWFMGNILSGPPSYVLNGLSPILSRTLMKLERGVGALASGNTDLFKATMSLDSMFGSVNKAWSMGAKAVKTDSESLLGGSRALDPESAAHGLGAFHSSNFNSKFMSSEPMVMIMDTMNTLTRLPFRLNGGADVINKTFAVDNYLNTHYRMEGLAKNLTGDELGAYIDKNVRKMFNEDGSLFSEERMMKAYAKRAMDEGFDETDPTAIGRKHAEFMETKLNEIGGDLNEMDLLARRAEDFARESTFTGESGPLTRLLNSARDHIPLTKFLIPFVNTPMQILHFGWRRTLPGMLIEEIMPRITKGTKQFKAEFEALGPMEQAARRGRIATAVGTTGALAYYANNNRDSITGGGPRNPAERKALEATGWRPYSFVTTDEEGNKTYVSYQRVDPFATMIGIVADIAEFAEMNPRSEDELSESMSALAFTVAENMTDKSFLRGLNNVLNIFADPETYIPKTVRDIGAGMAVPMFIDKVKGYEGEQMIRENRSLSDAILRKLPIAEESVPPKRTFLGEAVYKQNPLGLVGIFNPIYVASQKNDIVDDKIQDMLYGFSMPSANYLNHGDTDMRKFYNENGKQAYDRFLELTSTTKIQGRDMRTALKSLFKSSAYKSAEQNYKTAFQAGAPGLEDPRVRLTKRVISRYRRIAKRDVIAEFPELQQTVRQMKIQRNQLNNPIPTL